MAEERDGEHVSAEEQILQARAALNAATPTEEQLSFDDLKAGAPRRIELQRAADVSALGLQQLKVRLVYEQAPTFAAGGLAQDAEVLEPGERRVHRRRAELQLSGGTAG